MVEKMNVLKDPYRVTSRLNSYNIKEKHIVN